MDENEEEGEIFEFEGVGSEQERKSHVKDFC